MIFRIIRDHLTPEFNVVDCCCVLKVSTAGYYRGKKCPVGKRDRRREELAGEIRIVHEASRRTYGAIRISNEPRKQGRHLARPRRASGRR